MDETGIQLGQATGAKVIVPARCKYQFVTQDGNRENVTVVECIGASGTVLPPLVIFKGTYHQWGWYDNSVPQDWVIGISPKGWTDETLSLEWLQRIFDIQTEPTKEDQYRLLLVDGHSSHISWEFIEHCLDNKIIALRLPLHSTRWLQPLEVGVFSPLQHYYCSEVDTPVRNGLVSITKPLFIALYSQARTQAFQSRTIPLLLLKPE